MRRTDISARVVLACLTLVLAHCKSWNKFWEANSAQSIVLADSVNFAAANFQTSIYSGYNLWNDYVKNDGATTSINLVSSPFTAGSSASGQSTRLNASGTACSILQTGGYSTCIHAGMMRSFNISNITSCAGLVVDDSLGAFHWVCEKRASDLRIVSVGFKEGKYLTDLIDFAAIAFKSMSVTVKYQGQSVTSTPQVWWNNSVQNLPGAAFGVQSGIYLVQTNPNISGIFPQADRVALIVKPGVTVTKPSAAFLFDSNSKNFLWLEGTFDNNHTGGAFACFNILNSAFVALVNVGCRYGNTATSASNFILGTKNSYFRDVHAAGAAISNQKSFDWQTTADSNLIAGLRSSNGQQPLLMAGTNNIFLNTTLMNHALATNLTTNGSNIFTNLTEANNATGAAGAIQINGGANNTFMNLGVANAAASALAPSLANVNTQIINFSLYLISGNVLSGAASSFTYLTGVGKINVNTCANLANAGWSVTCTPTLASDYSLVTNIDATNSYVGKIITNEPVNSTDTNGTAPWASSTDWLNFSNTFRGYGADGSAFPNASNQSWCNTTCRIWDWSLAAGDTVYKGALAIPTGNDVASHRWSAGSQVTCTQPGAQWFAGGICDRPPYPGTAGTCAAALGTLSVSGCLTKFLRNAYEILDDGIGNENGLCESNEACIYTPNIASYQGHGNLTCIRGPADLGCTTTFTNGTILNVVLYQYATNGY